MPLYVFGRVVLRFWIRYAKVLHVPWNCSMLSVGSSTSWPFTARKRRCPANDVKSEWFGAMECSEWIALSEKSGGSHEPMLTNAEGTRVLKPVDEADRTSQREVLAYKALAKSSLGPFLCTFHGVRNVGDVQYMELDSAYAGMHGPTATLDIKIGKKTWEDDASPAKVAKESKKFDEIYSNSSAMDGFRVAGMKAGDLVLNSGNLKARFSLKTDEFRRWLLPAFFANHPGFGPLPEGLGTKPDSRSCDIDMRAAADILQTLRAISGAAELGFGGSLRASSLLLTREMRFGGKCVVRLIDFAHFSPSDGYRDANFCDGLQNLIQVWSKWCPRCPRERAREQAWCVCCGPRKG